MVNRWPFAPKEDPLGWAHDLEKVAEIAYGEKGFDGADSVHSECDRVGDVAVVDCVCRDCEVKK